MFRTAMVMIACFVVVMTPALPTGTAAAASSEEVKKETGEAWEAIKDYLHDQKHEATAHGHDLLKKVDAEIDELEAKAADASGDAKKEYSDTIKNLKKLRAEAGNKLDELENSSADASDSSKEGFSKAYKDLYHAYRDAKAKF